MTLSPEEMAAQRREHEKGPGRLGTGEPYCAEDDEPWPCRTIRLLNDVETLRETLEDEVKENLEIAERIGIMEDIKGGMSYHDAEIRLFETLHNALAAVPKHCGLENEELLHWAGGIDALHMSRKAENPDQRPRNVTVRAALYELIDQRNALAGARQRMEELERELALEKTNGDCIMEIRGALKERFDVEAAFFDDVIALALRAAANEERDTLQKRVEELERALQAEKEACTAWCQKVTPERLSNTRLREALWNLSNTTRAAGGCWCDRLPCEQDHGCIEARAALEPTP